MRYLCYDMHKWLDVLVFSDEDDRVSLNCCEICPPVGLKENGDYFSVPWGGKNSISRTTLAHEAQIV